MRELVRLEQETRARTLGDVLYVEGIGNHVDETRNGDFAVWVHDDAHLERARELWRAYEAAPDDPQFAEARRQAQRMRKEAERTARRDRYRTVRVRESWSAPRGSASLTLTLIVVSVVVSALHLLGKSQTFAEMLLFDLPHIARGQVWRLITPIFLHFGALHLLFDMLWLRDLGSMVERRQAPWFLGVFVLVVAITSNFAQYAMTGPAFGGMSGVVYGLLGYIGLRGRLDPGSGYRIPRFILIWMLGWLVLCFTPLIPHVANAAHTVGLGVGAGWALLASWPPARRR